MLSKNEISRLFKSVRQYNTDRLIEILTELADYVVETEDRRDKAVKQLEEFNKDEEIVKLKKQLEQKENRIKNSQTFVILPEEVKVIEEWKKQHTKEKHGGSEYAGAIGGRYSYKFTPTSIGTFGTIICDCGEKFEFADGSDF